MGLGGWGTRKRGGRGSNRAGACLERTLARAPTLAPPLPASRARSRIEEMASAYAAATARLEMGDALVRARVGRGRGKGRGSGVAWAQWWRAPGPLHTPLPTLFHP